MEFKLDGKSVLPTAGYDSKKIKKHLDSLKDGDLLSPATLADKLNLAAGYLREVLKTKLPDYTVNVKNKTYFGSVKTIKAYKALQ